MARHPTWPAKSAAAALALAAVLSGCEVDSFTNLISPLNAFKQTRLVADVVGTGARTVDPSLVNPWGIAFGPTGALWVSNNGTGTSTLYDAAGNKLPMVVAVPGNGGTAGAPTGIVFNSTADFLIPGQGPALFIFAGEDGTIAAWNTSTVNARLVADRSSSNAVYTGVAIASNNGANFLYLTDFRNNRVDVFDRAFAFVQSFADSTIPAGYAPFGIANIAGQLFVTFAEQLGPDNKRDSLGVSNGFVDVFNADGSLSRRFASNGRLNAPWAVAVAPSGFGGFGGAILIGNFGDGLIGAYNATSGEFIDNLRDLNSTPIVIDGLRGLAFGPSAISRTLYFAAGPAGGSHGLVGTLTRP
jgi:uncharacterized protein (TIGR03118 family)